MIKPKTLKTGAGRPMLFGDIIMQKLEQAFAMGCTDEEACLYADISKRTFYYYQRKIPELLQRKELLKANPVLKARQKVVSQIEHDTETAKWYLERKSKGEFGNKEAQVNIQANFINQVNDDKKQFGI